MYEEKIAKGATLLDKIRPGWDQEVDPGTINIASCKLCILGQLFGDYAEGYLKVFATHPVNLSGNNCGFNVIPSDDYQQLNKEWGDFLKSRS